MPRRLALLISNSQYTDGRLARLTAPAADAGALAKVLGVVFVVRSGAPASRWRVTARNVAAWLPFVLQPSGIALLSPTLGPVGALFSVAGLCAALALVSVLLPSRGLADRMVGTWPVPR